MAFAHLLGHLSTLKELRAPSDEPTRQLFSVMNGYLLKDIPFDRSLMSIYLGLSLCFTIFCLLVAGLMLTATKALAHQPEPLRRLARMYLAGVFTLTVISMAYFIWQPTVLCLVALGLAAFGMARLRKPRKAEDPGAA